MEIDLLNLCLKTLKLVAKDSQNPYSKKAQEVLNTKQIIDQCEYCAHWNQYVDCENPNYDEALEENTFKYPHNCCSWLSNNGEKSRCPFDNNPTKYSHLNKFLRKKAKIVASIRKSKNQKKLKEAQEAIDKQKQLEALESPEERKIREDKDIKQYSNLYEYMYTKRSVLLELVAKRKACKHKDYRETPVYYDTFACKCYDCGYEWGN
jgi:hypothetical protein